MRNRNVNILSVPRRSLRQEKMDVVPVDYLPLLADPGHQDLKDLKFPAKNGAVESTSANPSWQTKDELK